MAHSLETKMVVWVSRAATLVVVAVATNAALAQDARQSYDIPAGALAPALRSLASTAGVMLSFTADQTEGKTTAGIKGEYLAADALTLLLNGSGLQVVQLSNGGFILRASATLGVNEPKTMLPLVRAVARAAPVPEAADDRYQPTYDASTLRTTASMLDIPQVVNVVPAQVIRDQRPRNLDDALVNVSGIVQGNTLASTQDTIMKRGFGGNRDGSIMHNGMPLVQGHGLNAAAESVEVLKGPASLLYGLMDPGGVINVVSKKPLLERSTSLSTSGSGYEGGRNGYGATLDTTGPLSDAGVGYRLVVDHVDEEYWRNFGVHRETLVAPSLAWYGESTQAVVWYEYRKYLTPFDRGTALDPRTRRVLDIPRTRRLDEPFNAMDGETHLGQFSVDHSMNDTWAAHVSFSYNRETYDANQLRVNGINTTLGTLARSNDATHGALSTDTYGTAYVDGTIEIAGMRHSLQFGGDAEYRKIYREDLLRQATRSVFSYLNPVYGTEAPSATVSASDSDQTDRLHNAALFLQDAVSLGERWVAVGALRYQDWSQVAGRGRPFKANTDTEGNEWLPQAGLVYKWNDVLSLYGLYAQSLKPTSTIAPLASGVIIDSTIAPEEAKSYELGVKLDVPERLTATLALFDIHKKNVLVSQFNDETKLTDWRTSGAARSRGLEVDVSGQITSRLGTIASYAYIDAKITDDPLYAGNELWNVARQIASLSGVYDFGELLGDDRFRLGAGARYVGRRPGDSANSFDLPHYTVADLFATYDTAVGAQPLKLQLNVKNVFDDAYYTSSVNTYCISMGDARQVSLSATVEF